MLATMEPEIRDHVQADLRAFIAKRVGNEADADDLLQEVLVRMQRGMNRLHDPERLVSWLYQITRNVIVDHYRSATRRREIPAGFASDFEARMPTEVSTLDPSNEARIELTQCIRPMLNQLSAEYREAVQLIDLDGLPQQIAADRLGLSLSGMKSRVQRGRKQLKDALDRCCLIQLDRRRGVIDYTERRGGCDSC